MRKWFSSLIATFLTACSPSTDWVEGGMYATPNDDGSFGIVKILKIEDGGVHLRMYSNNFDAIPGSVDEVDLYMAGMDRKPNESLGMGHAPISRTSFSQWGAVFIQQSTVSLEELEGYEMWREGGGGFF